MVQWLRLCSECRGHRFNLWRGTKPLHAMWHGQKETGTERLISTWRRIRCWNYYIYFKAAITKLFKLVIINTLEKKSLKQPERKDTLSLGELQLEWEWWHFLIWKCEYKRDLAQPISATEIKELIKYEFYVYKKCPLHAWKLLFLPLSPMALPLSIY